MALRSVFDVRARIIIGRGRIRIYCRVGGSRGGMFSSITPFLFVSR